MWRRDDRGRYYQTTETYTEYYWENHGGKHSIVNMVFPLMNFVNGPLRPGQMMSLPFTIQLPDWLPASMILGGRTVERALLSIEYLITAQFTPTDYML